MISTAPKVERPPGGGFHITGDHVPDDSLPPHERKVWVPDELLPELVTMDGDAFRAHMAARRQTPGEIYRVQTLSRYDVASDGGSAAGQTIRVLDVAEHPEAEELFVAGDFWVIEGEDVILQPYDEQGRILDRQLVGRSTAPGYRALAELAWRIATPFTDWWNGRPQYHRVNRADLAHSRTDVHTASRT